MSKRSEHTFQFSAGRLAEAAKAEGEYHRERVRRWREVRDESLERVKETAGVKVTETQVTGGKQVSLAVDHGDPEAWQRFQIATEKVHRHQGEAERFESDAAVYASQPDDRAYELDADDVHHFRLNGRSRED
jgi:hypothetical protein